MRFMGTAAIGVQPPEVIYAGTGNATSTPVNTVTASGQDIGPESASRHIFVIVRAFNANTVSDANNVTSVTIAGVAATKLYATPGSTVQHWTLWRAAVPTGTTGTISVTRSIGNGFSSCGFVVFSAYNLRNTTPNAPVLSVVPGSSTISVDLLASGILMAMANAPGASWTGATEVVDVATSHTGALLSGTTAEIGHSISLSIINAAMFAVTAR